MLSIFSPTPSYPLSFEDEYPLSPFGLEDQPSSSSFHSFASLSGLAEQLCSSSSPTSSTSSSYGPDRSAYMQAQSSLDNLFGKDLYSDFSSDDDFFTPTFSVNDLPSSPSPYQANHYPSTPPPNFAFAAPRSKASSASSSSWNGGGGSGASFNSWDQPALCDPVEVCYPSNTEESWLVDEAVETEVGSTWAYPESLTTPAYRLSSKASMESLGEWDGLENVPESWIADGGFFSSNSPAWTSSVSSPPSTISSPAVHQRAAHRTRSNPSIQPSAPRTHLPAKASMPALKEEAADDAYSYVFDGGAQPNGAASHSSMFAVLGGYGGEEQSLGQEWNSRTVGRDAYGGGWSAGPSQRFEVENVYPSVIPTSLMGGGCYQTPRSVSSSSSVPSTPKHSPLQHAQPEYAHPPASPSARSFITPKKLSRRVSPIIPTLLIPGRRPSTAPSQPLMSTGPLASAPRRASTAPSTPKGKAASSSKQRPVPVVQMRQQEQELKREEYRRTAVDRKVDPSLASVLIQGWEPSAESPAALIVKQQDPSPPRVIARLPSLSPRSTSTSPTPRRAYPTSNVPFQPPRAVQRPAIEAPAHKGGYTTFINYTMADAESLLMGVAPSGAPQPKKKRSGEDLQKEAGGSKRRA